ncbi:hypothetical protein E4U58_000991 [Claviceps cyperi]|nr:hypothetical protein E4U58_000991 [Claviceps cyperi]
MDQLFIDAIEQNPTAGYLTEFRKEAENMGVRHSADLDNLGRKSKTLRPSQASWALKAATTPLPSLRPLLSRAIDQVDDADLWRKVKVVFKPESEGTPPPIPIVLF